MKTTSSLGVGVGRSLQCRWRVAEAIYSPGAPGCEAGGGVPVCGVSLAVVCCSTGLTARAPRRTESQWQAACAAYEGRSEGGHAGVAGAGAAGCVGRRSGRGHTKACLWPGYRMNVHSARAVGIELGRPFASAGAMARAYGELNVAASFSLLLRQGEAVRVGAGAAARIEPACGRRRLEPRC